MSSCYTKYKINAFNTFFYRAYKLTSNYISFHREITYLEDFFKTNGFHPDLFHHHLRKFLNKQYSSEMYKYGPKKLQLFLRFPYLSNRLNSYVSNKVKHIFERYFPQITPSLAFYNNFKIKNFCNHKDKLSSNNVSNVVYKFVCSSCQLAYVGSTIKTLEQRVFEHLGTSFRTNRSLTRPLQSSIREHCQSSCKCNFSVDDFNIIFKGSYQDEIWIAESIFIKKLHPTLNSDSSSVPLSIT